MMYGDSSSRVGDTLDSLARVRLVQNRVAEAEKLTREALLPTRFRAAKSTPALRTCNPRWRKS